MTEKGPRPTRASAKGVAVAAGILCGGAGAGLAQADEPPPPTALIAGRNVGLLVIDNSHADSWLEIDRTLNFLIGAKGTAGSDHDGGGGAIDVQAGESTAPAAPPATGTDGGTAGGGSGSWIPLIGHPPWQGENGD
ncbi:MULTISPECIES: hypothetical protein [unclassified Streptomyces]|uniref:hypothetical protein n=1 Tax=unclassified Streptomyces TaxID=2593676 RepID=UPI002E2BCF26|nr:hypothetical protein [Streptomyces sp. NBC_01429]